MFKKPFFLKKESLGKEIVLRSKTKAFCLSGKSLGKNSA